MSQKIQELELAVLSGETMTVIPLGATGQLTVGRDEKNDLRIEDSAVSRRHCVLHLGSPLRLEDLGGANGTFLSERAHAAATNETQALRKIVGKTVDVGPGDVLTLGSTLLAIRRARSSVRPPSGEESLAMAAPTETPIVRSPATAALYKEAAQAARASISVLILGETGVGKEVLARAIHEQSSRASSPFVGLNCAALPSSLLESELFGHEKGTFTGANEARPGLLEAAGDGTVFLDEIGELPIAVQVKLLRVLEERTVLRVGSRTPRSIGARFISATNRDLEAAVSAGTFRADLYFRLNGIAFSIPPLRERPIEIVPLATLFIGRACQQLDRPAEIQLTDDARRALEAYSWPGNIRELRNAMERAVVLCNGDAISTAHLPAKIAAAEPSPTQVVTPVVTQSNQGLHDEVNSLEQRRILEALEQCGGNRTKAAALLGISRRTMVSRVREYGIGRAAKKS